jgi:hypothetical protein
MQDDNDKTQLSNLADLQALAQTEVEAGADHDAATVIARVADLVRPEEESEDHRAYDAGVSDDGISKADIDDWEPFEEEKQGTDASIALNESDTGTATDANVSGEVGDRDASSNMSQSASPTQTLEVFGDDALSGVLENIDAIDQVRERPPTEEPKTAGVEQEAVWYVAVDDEQVGPVSVDEVQAYWLQDKIDADAMAWKAGMQDWLPVAEIGDLAYLLTEHPKNAGQQGDLEWDGSSGSSRPRTNTIEQVSFGGNESGSAGWAPSAAEDLSSLVEDELTQAQEAQDDSKTPVPAGLPSLGEVSNLKAEDLFGGSDDLFAHPGATESTTDELGYQASDNFSLPVPQGSSSGIKPVYLLIAGVCVVIVLVVGVLVVVDRGVSSGNRSSQEVASGDLQPQELSSALATKSSTKGKTVRDTGTPSDAKVAQRVSGSSRAPLTGEKTDATQPAVSSKDRLNPKTQGATTSKSKSKSKSKIGKSRKRGKFRPDDLFMDAGAGKAPVKQLKIEDIVKGVKKNAKTVMRCIQNAKNLGELGAGKHTLLLDFTIKPSGGVRKPVLKGPANLARTSLGTCFPKAMKKWTFRASKSGAPVKNYPFGPFNIK